MLTLIVGCLIISVQVRKDRRQQTWMKLLKPMFPFQFQALIWRIVYLYYRVSRKVVGYTTKQWYAILMYVTDLIEKLEENSDEWIGSNLISSSRYLHNYHKHNLVLFFWRVLYQIKTLYMEKNDLWKKVDDLHSLIFRYVLTFLTPLSVFCSPGGTLKDSVSAPLH